MVLQSSAATYLRCDEIYNDYFVAKFGLKLTVKEFWKSINISRSYRPEWSILFFDTNTMFRKGWNCTSPPTGGARVGKFEPHYFRILWSMPSPSKQKESILALFAIHHSRLEYPRLDWRQVRQIVLYAILIPSVCTLQQSCHRLRVRSQCRLVLVMKDILT